MARTDPIEAHVESTLYHAGVAYENDVEAPNGSVLDFYCSKMDLFIEVKQFSTERTEKQIEGLTNVILVPGRQAAEQFRELVLG